MSSHENLIKIFQYALQQEETGKSFLRDSLQRMGMGAAISAFKRLIQEEEHHILLIKRILGGSKSWESGRTLHRERIDFKTHQLF